MAALRFFPVIVAVVMVFFAIDVVILAQFLRIVNRFGKILYSIGKIRQAQNSLAHKPARPKH
jgi:nucleoside recognition membrane protein YjiH